MALIYPPRRARLPVYQQGSFQASSRTLVPIFLGHSSRAAAPRLLNTALRKPPRFSLFTPAPFAKLATDRPEFRTSSAGKLAEFRSSWRARRRGIQFRRNRPVGSRIRDPRCCCCYCCTNGSARGAMAPCAVANVVNEPGSRGAQRARRTMTRGLRARGTLAA